MKKLVLITTIVLFCLVSKGQQQLVTKSPIVAQSTPYTPPPGGQFWQSPNSISASDGISAVVQLSSYGSCNPPNCYISERLQAKSFGFNIPLTATITGVKVDIKRSASVAGYVSDSEVKLIKASVPTGTNNFNSANWGTTLTYTSYGSSTDLWGAVLTPTDVNSNQFGVSLRVYNYLNNVATANVDHMSMTIYYTQSCGGLTLSVSGIAHETTLGANNGSASFSFNGATPFTWNRYLNSTFISSGNESATTFSVNNLNPGSWKYVVTDVSGCKDSTTFMINAGVTNTVTATSVVDFENVSAFHFFPNPVNGFLTIQFPYLTNESVVQIFDITGRLVKTIEINETETQIGVADLNTGMYLLKLNNGKNCVTKRFVKQ